MQRLRIAVDMDEVIADALSAQLDWLQARFGYVWEPPQLHGKRLRQLLGADHAEALEAHLQLGEFFGTLRCMPGSQDALRRLSRHHDVFITTAAMEYPASMPFKWKWLRTHFGFLDPMNIVFCGDKRIVAADIMIDDNARHFAHFRGQGVLFSAPHNAAEQHYPRLGSWDEADALLQHLAQQR